MISKEYPHVVLQDYATIPTPYRPSRYPKLAWSWNFDDLEEDSIHATINVEKIIREVSEKMFGAEEEAYTKLVIQALEGKGYKVTKNDFT